MVGACVCICEPALVLHAYFHLMASDVVTDAQNCCNTFVPAEVPVVAKCFSCAIAMVSLPMLSLLCVVAASKEGRFAQAQAHNGFVIKVKAPKEADAEVLESLDGLMRSAQKERAAADAEFAASKSKMLVAERAEVQRIVRGSRR